MTVNTTNIVTGPYVGNDIADEFSYDFRIENSSQVEVYQTIDDGLETILILDTDYTVDSVGGDSGGLITRIAGALPTGYKWWFRANYQQTQSTAFGSQGGFFPDVHEDAMDKMTFLIQQLQDESNRSIKVQVTSPVDPDELVQSLLEAEENAVDAAASAEADAQQTALDRIATGEDVVSSQSILDSVGTEGTTQVNLVIAEGDTQVARVIAEGDTQVARVITEGDTQEQRVTDEGVVQIALATAQADRSEDEADRAQGYADSIDPNLAIHTTGSGLPNELEDLAVIITSTVLTGGQDWGGVTYTDPDAIGANPEATLYPDGTIVGSTDNGSYVKFPNGYLTIRISNLIGVVGGNVVTFPHSFKVGTVPVTSGTGRVQTPRHPTVSPISNTGCTVFMWSDGGVASTSPCDFLATGRWK